MQVASEDVSTISLDQLDQVVGTYAKVPIPAKSLVTEPMLTCDQPRLRRPGRGRDPAQPGADACPGSPAATLVQVIRIAGAGGGDGGAEVLGEGLVMKVSDGSSDQLGGSQTGSLNLLVPAEAAASIVNAAGSSTAGLAILDRGQPTDVDLSGPEQ